MKPSWDDAPEWAMWLAMDEDGEWWWYEDEPFLILADHGEYVWCMSMNSVMSNISNSGIIGDSGDHILCEKRP